MLINIKDKLYKTIEQYCEINEINDIEDFICSLISKNFMIEKYGERPKVLENKTKTEDVQDIKTIKEPEIVKTIETEKTPKTNDGEEVKQNKEETKEEKPKRKIRKRILK